MNDNPALARRRPTLPEEANPRAVAMAMALFISLLVPCSIPSGCSKPSGPCPTRQIYAKVTRALDGDTVLLNSGDKVRYIGIDAPEKGECFAEEAARRNHEIVAGKEVRLELDVRLTDPYGRLLAYVYLDETFVNALLIGEGYCRAAAFAPNTKHREFFEALEEDAKRDERGMWGQCGRGEYLDPR